MSHASPLIGIPCRFDGSATYHNRPINAQNTAYLTAVEAAGGTPFLIPLNLPDEKLYQLYRVADGILLSGGGDVNPACYKEARSATVGGVQEERDRTEILLTQWAAKEGKPFFGICRGIQILNVALGGSLYQDIISQQVSHNRHDFFDITEQPRDYLAHSVKVQAGSRLHQILETDSLKVNSLHHQSLKHVPAPLTITGQAEDGVTEAVEHPDHPFFLGVQWHPEELYENNADARRLFAAFVRVCQG